MTEGKVKIGIAGAGLSGLSCAVFLKNSDKKNLFEISILESSPKPGGRTYSFADRDTGMVLDNGQHILAGWYKSTLEYLKICNPEFVLNFQNNLEINFYDTENKFFKFKCPDLFSPVNLVMGILKYDAFSIKDKLSFLKIWKLINREEFNTEYLKKIDVLTLLNDLKQTDNSIKYFWEPFLLAVFNCRLNEINGNVFMNVMMEGFSGKGNSNLLIPEKDLNSLLINDSLKFLNQNSVEIIYNNKVNEIIKEENGKIKVITNNSENNEFDLFINAASFFRLGDISYNFDFEIPDLKTSSIISVHLIFESEIPELVLKNNSFGMTGLIGTNTQWIFKKSENHLSLVISGADFLEYKGNRLIDCDKEVITDMCIEELNKCLTGFDNLKVKNTKVIKEKRATFIPDENSVTERNKAGKDYGNYYICGDWTETELPATIEAAVRSGNRISNKILKKFYN